MDDPGIAEVRALPFWRGAVEIRPLIGGITNRNFGVTQTDGQKFAVRLGHDIPVHGVMRFNELAAAIAAARAGISPQIRFTAPGVLVTDLLPGRTLTPAEIRRPENLARIVSLLKTCHTGMADFLAGPLLAFWVFHINRSYAAGLQASRIADQLPGLLALNTRLERAVGRVEVVFGHNDLLAGNIFDDGTRLWLLDWDYAGFNTPLFDLANLSSNNDFAPPDDASLLTAYFGAATPATLHAFNAMKCASLLREALWSAISELHSTVDFDYVGYTTDYLARLEAATVAL